MLVGMDLFNTNFVLLQVSTDVSQAHCVLRSVGGNAVGWTLPWSVFAFFSQSQVLSEGNARCVCYILWLHIIDQAANSSRDEFAI
jgi:hypothetical protein